MADAQTLIPGWYGKIPSLGDFASRRLPQSFVAAWDSWLQRGLKASQLHCGEKWLDLYLTSPIWRFALMPGVCGSDAWAGVVMPSIDKVGRYFPLTVALPVSDETDFLAAVVSAQAWYCAIEQVALSTLNVDFSADDLERRLAAHPFEVPGRGGTGNSGEAQVLANWWASGAENHKVVQLPSLDALPETLGSVANRVFASLGRGRSLWWTGAAPGGLAELCCFNGLPPESRFATLLHGPTVPPGL